MAHIMKASKSGEIVDSEKPRASKKQDPNLLVQKEKEAATVEAPAAQEEKEKGPWFCRACKRQCQDEQVMAQILGFLLSYMEKVM